MAAIQPGAAQSVGKLAELLSLPEAAQIEISQLCLPIHYRDGATAFRNCVSDEIAKRKSDAALLLEGYSFNEKYALQQTCASVLENNQRHLDCVQQEIIKLDSIAPVDLSELNDEEHDALQKSCFSVQKSSGAAAYRSCTSDAATEMLKIPRTDLSQLSIAVRTTIKNNCLNSVQINGTSNYRMCLAEALAELLKSERANQPTENQPAQNSTAGEAAVIVSSSDLNSTTTEIALASMTPQSSADNTTNGTPADTIVAGLIDNSISSTNAEQLSTIGRTDFVPNATTQRDNQSPLTAIRENPAKFFTEIGSHPANYYIKLLLPFLIILTALSALRFMMSKRQHREPAPMIATPRRPTVDYADDDFHDSLLNDPTFTTSNGGIADEYDHPFDGVVTGIPDQAKSKVQNRDAFDEPGEYQLDISATTRFYRPDEPAPAIPTASSRDFAQPQLRSYVPSDVQPQVESMGEAEPALLDRTLTTPVYSESDFGKWLHDQPIEDHKRLCTEFMLYWISFGDGQYDPRLKQNLLRAVELNEHDLIKKWVLEENPSTLVDMLQRIWSLFSKEEVEQTISLMFALLVKREITPIQNTFFRFLADFAHIGDDGLQKLYHDAFDEKLPPLPRPDDERWWSHQNKRTAEDDFDSNLGNDEEKSDYEICLSMLGLSEPTSNQEIERAYAQLAKRCNPERFNLLGEKERSLVQRHLAKYTKAYEYLTETA